jgi:Glyoxalase/Bleomycin resistance protein/Dioxygenase superfamily
VVSGRRAPVWSAAAADDDVAPGPVHLELIEGTAGSPFDGSGGARLDHLSYWVADLGSERRRLEGNGIKVVLDGEALGVPANFHATADGLRLEPMSIGRRATIVDRYRLEDPG